MFDNSSTNYHLDHECNELPIDKLSILHDSFTITLSLVPGAAPGGLTAVMVTYNSMYVMWEALSFLDQNSPSVYYNLTYYVLGSMQGVATRVIQNRLNASISSLQSFTTYKVDVAAQNDIGTGPFASINVTTLAARKSEFMCI